MKKLLVLCAALLVSTSIGGARAADFTTVYKFHGGSDGIEPVGGLIKDASGNLYGTTSSGGGASCGTGCGTVFSLAPDNTETILYAFTGGTDGNAPIGYLNRDVRGNLYGDTRSGGYTGSNCVGGASGCGTVWQLAPNGALKVLHSFEQDDANDGALPPDGLHRGAGGYHYGVTSSGGVFCRTSFTGCGTIQKTSNKGVETSVYSFQGADGATPSGMPIFDPAGNLYGVTHSGGTALGHACGDGVGGCGVIYKLAPDGTETVLYSFSGGSDGAYPLGALARDKTGNLYGLAQQGGVACQESSAGCGTVFKLAPDGTFTVLHTFTGGTDGALPTGALYIDRLGYLYGATQSGPVGVETGFLGNAVVFEINPNGTFVTLHTFSRISEGVIPTGVLLPAGDGSLYGTTLVGGDQSCGSGGGCGTIFRIQRFP